MKTRDEVIQYCMTFADVYEDYPFHDANWTVMRHKKNKKGFAFLFEKDEVLMVNIKCSPEWIQVFRDAYDAVFPAYHMNKRHWNTLRLDGSIPDGEIRRMIAESYDCIRPAEKREPRKGGQAKRRTDKKD